MSRGNGLIWLIVGWSCCAHAPCASIDPRWAVVRSPPLQEPQMGPLRQSRPCHRWGIDVVRRRRRRMSVFGVDWKETKSRLGLSRLVWVHADAAPLSSLVLLSLCSVRAPRLSLRSLSLSLRLSTPSKTTKTRGAKAERDGDRPRWRGWRARERDGHDEHCDDRVYSTMNLQSIAVLQ